MGSQYIPWVVILDSAVDRAVGIPEAEKAVLDAASKACLVSTKCVQYVSSSDLGQLAWWYNSGARIFVGVNDLSSSSLYDFFNVRGDAVYLCATVADSVGLYNVFSYGHEVPLSVASDFFNLVTGTLTGIADFAATGVLLTDGAGSDDLQGYTVVPSVAYPLSNAADLADIVANHSAELLAASAIMISTNPPDLVVQIIETFPGKKIVTQYKNKAVREAAADQASPLFVFEETVSYQFMKLLADTFQYPVNTFFETLVVAAQTAQLLQRSNNACCGASFLANSRILKAQFVQDDVETTRAQLPDVEYDYYEEVAPGPTVIRRRLPHQRAVEQK